MRIVRRSSAPPSTSSCLASRTLPVTGTGAEALVSWILLVLGRSLQVAAGSTVVFPSALSSQTAASLDR